MNNANLYPPKTNPEPGTTRLVVGQLRPMRGEPYCVLRAWTNGNAHTVLLTSERSKRAALDAARTIAATTGEAVSS